MVCTASGNSLKALHVIPAVAPRYGGPSRVIFEMSRALQASGIEVLIATTDADGPARLSVCKGMPISHQGAETIFFPVRLSERFSYSPKLARWLNKNVKNFDVVHIHAIFSHPSLEAAGACRRNGVPYIVRPLGSLDPWSMSQRSWLKSLMWHASVKRMLREAAAVHYTTNEEQTLAESTLGLARGVVVPLGIQVDEPPVAGTKSFRHTQSGLDDNPYILALSRLHPKKNLESLIEAFVSLDNVREFSQWRLVIAGDGESDYVEQLKKIAQPGSDLGRIIFTGWLSGADRIEVLRNAELLALPSHQENFGLSAVEALAYGVPVIVSHRVNLASEVRAANAGWVTGLEPKEIASTLREALQDAAERQRRGRAAQEFVSTRLSWTKVAGQLTELYRTVLDERVNVVTPSQNFQLAGQ